MYNFFPWDKHIIGFRGCCPWQLLVACSVKLMAGKIEQCHLLLTGILLKIVCKSWSTRLFFRVFI